MQSSNKIIEIPQWGSISDWNEANRAIEHLVRIHNKNLKHAFGKALDIKAKLSSLFPILDEFCQETCVHCSSTCCITATVWLDFCDLIYIHLSGAPIPPHQLIEKQPDSCKYNSLSGCTLPRLSRPWVCTMYLCPPQMALHRKKDELIRSTFNDTILSLKNDRKLLEKMFINVCR